MYILYMSTETAPIAHPTTATPVEIDGRLAELDRAVSVAEGVLRARVDQAHHYLGERARQVTRSRMEWPTTDAEALIALATRLDAGTLKPWDVDRAGRVLAEVAELNTAILVNRTEAAHLDAEYDRRPWRRYIGVLGGHLHSGTRCAGGTIRPSTQITWHPLLSGKAVADAVAELGPLLCTHCFPDAPVEWQAGAPKPTRCAGSGAPEEPGTFRRQGMSAYGECQKCHTVQTLTPGGRVIRAHKPAAE